MAEAINEGLLDKLKTAIKTSTAGAKARAEGDWFREKAHTKKLKTLKKFILIV